MDHGDPSSPVHRRFEALAAARRLAQEGHVAPGSGRSHGVGFAALVEGVARGLVSTGPAGGHPPVASVAPPTGASEAEGTGMDAVGPCGAVPLPDGPCWILAIAPDHYDPVVVDGSEMPVMLEPLRRWARHPAYAGGGREAGKILRAWKASSEAGEALGLVLWTGNEFAGVGMSGDFTTERTLAGAAWQISANR